MKTYTIKPLDFSGGQTQESVESPIRILPERADWNIWIHGCTWGGPYPTFEAAVEAANEIHRKAVEKFLEPACNPQRKRSSWVTPEHGTDSQQ